MSLKTMSKLSSKVGLPNFIADALYRNEMIYNVHFNGFHSREAEIWKPITRRSLTSIFVQFDFC